MVHIRWNYQELASQRTQRWELRLRTKDAERREREQMLFERLPRLEAISLEQRSLVLKMAQAILTKSVPIAKLEERGLALSAERSAILARAGIDPGELEIQYDCPHCRDTGWIEPTLQPDQDLVSPAVKCECLRREEIADIYKASGLSGPMSELSFDRFDLSVYPEMHRAHMQGVLAVCKQYALDVSMGGPMEGLLLYGNVGVGKTLLATAIANAAVSAGRSVIYATWAEYLDVIRLWRLSDDLSERMALQQLMATELLVLDDLGAEKVTDFVGQELFTLINHRTQRRMATVVSSNLRPDEWREFYGDRIASRLLGGFEVYECRGLDVRMQKPGKLALRATKE